ncbi:hypothetical protein SDRG_03854 [Saprolegnia diclina VS20]|uniref:Uncharacterized protein n=1 Tax=Saprolegnia diclina (strain VS20) TaxID=1156394 RepID=T0QW45_SAPDV|nr:hypothetical protein SDRG_03854 [Saprolegnia diclina VS20]EQC38896.1 hypothetical protein SDRG_03854 [Saprolegnia diclina VS20]|eukprot:XP_008607720.1 hypothetical protein SDRG_03854 [Saprolegnia diclina VS20]
MGETTRVGPSPTAVRFCVRRNRSAMLVSLIMLLNILSMPMKAYLSEFLPWQTVPALPDAFANYSSFSNATLAYQQAHYTPWTLPNGSKYFDDAAMDVQVLRATLNLTNHEPIRSRADCLASFVLGLPGLIYYTPVQLDLVCALAADADVNASSWDKVGACYVDKFCTIVIGHSCVWLSAGDAVHGGELSPHVVTITYTFTGTRLSQWLWWKLGFRTVLTIFVAWRLWQQYYAHCQRLQECLAVRGHCANLSPTEWRYELVLGDPTAIILMDPSVACAFVVDIWISTNSVGIAVLRASQNGDLYVMFVTFVYLSRTVWFAYCALCVAAYCLKKWKIEHAFTEVDPTLVAVGVAIYGPLVSWLSGNVGFLALLYQWTFTLLVPSSLLGQENELGPGCAMYTLLIACLPLAYGFAIPALRHRFCKHRSKTPNYASPFYNSIKNRTIFGLLAPFRPSADVYPVEATKRILERGGAIYSLFATNSRYKNCPTISLRSADCFLLCYHNESLVSKIRLSLLCSLDCNAATPELAPARAYLSESFPGIAPTIVSPVFAPFGAFENATLSAYMTAYSDVSALGYQYDQTSSIYVLRRTLDMSATPTALRCVTDFALGLPGLIYYTGAQLNFLCAFLASDIRRAYVNHGACHVDRSCALDIGYSCIWLSQRKEDPPDVYVLSYAYTATRWNDWLWIKLVYRIGITGLIAQRLYSGYFKHVRDLETILRSHGHCLGLDAHTWRYELVLGDPTAIVLMDGWVAFALVVDTWLSTNTIGVAILLAAQADDLWVMALSLVYLSRTVWFAYFALCAVAHALKKWRCEHAFCEVDPTLVAIAVAIYGPLLSQLSVFVEWLVRLYHWLFVAFVPNDAKAHENELGPGCAMYTLMVASLPLLYGLAQPPWARHRTRWRHKVAPAVLQDYASPLYNSIKSRLLVRFLSTLQAPAPRAEGGSVYALFAANSRYKNCPTISLRSADCFLLCYHNEALVSKMRLSLLGSLDRNLGDPTLAVRIASVVATSNMNELVLHPGQPPTIRRPWIPSPWCI